MTDMEKREIISNDYFYVSERGGTLARVYDHVTYLKSPPYVIFRVGDALAAESRVSCADGAEVAGI